MFDFYVLLFGIVSDYYINHVSWYDNNAVLVSFLPREQTTLSLALCERYNNFRCREIYLEKAPGMWISPDVSFASAPKENFVLMRAPVKYSDELEEFFQIIKINVKVCLSSSHFLTIIILF